MNQSDRLYKIDQLLSAHRVLTRQQLLTALEVSWATLKRDLSFMRDRFNAPIVFDREAGGYRFDAPSAGPRYELPGLWFNADEAYALLTMHHLLETLEPGLLSPHVAPLLSRLDSILGRQQSSYAEITDRIRIAGTGRRRKNPEHFGVISRAVLERRRLNVRHYSRDRDQHSERELSPQRLTFYRNNWYLEAWCHQVNALRRFSVDAIQSVEVLKRRAKDVSARQLGKAFDESYGVYSGSQVKTARLRFSKMAARWVADEYWHPNQLAQIDSEGRLVLEVPYSHPTELKMDILRHGYQVEVLGPEALRAEITGEIHQMVGVYPTKTP